MTGFPTIAADDRRLNPIGVDGTIKKHSIGAASIAMAFTELRAKPEFGAPIDTQLVFGEDIEIFEQSDDWSLVRAERDGYCGWLESNTLRTGQAPASHLVSVPRTFLYPEPDLKKPHKGMRSMGSGLRIVEEVESRGTSYSILDTGEAIITRHLRKVSDHDADFVTVAESLLQTPYLWAGTTAFGIDCSGLVKLAFFMSGHNVLRDSDMQAAKLGKVVDISKDYSDLQRGDLIFWRGHVAICMGKERSREQMLIHANGHTMDVACEPVAQAIDRIAYLYEKPIGVRRPVIQSR